MPKISIASHKSNLQRFFAAPLAFVLTLGAPVGAPQAQGQSGTALILGTGLGVNLDTSQLYLAPSGRIYVPALPVAFSPEAEVYLNGEGLRWQLGFHALYDFEPPDLPFRPYAGGGVAVIGAPDAEPGESNNGAATIGMSVVGGVLFLPGPLHPFAQLRLSIGETNTLGLSGGLALRIRRRSPSP